MSLTFGTWLVLGACAVAVATDLRSRKIPNWLTAALALGALGFQAASGGLAAFGIAIATLLAVLFIGFVAFSFGWLGGGDVKLLAAGSAALGFPDAVPFLVYTAVGGGLLAIVFAIATGRLKTVMESVTLMMRPFAYKGTAPVKPANPIMLPYACAIAFGAVAVALSHTAAPFLRLPL